MEMLNVFELFQEKCHQRSALQQVCYLTLTFIGVDIDDS